MMTSFTNMTGLAGVALALAATALVLPGAARIPQRQRIGLACAVAVAVLLPFGSLPLAAYVRGATGDLSITTQLVLVLAIWRGLGGKVTSVLREGERAKLLLLIAAAALFLYPMALGWGMFDPYRLGFGSPWLLAALLALALAAYWRRLPAIALTIALAVFAWSIGWGESSNLWDYLLDPLLAVYAAGALLKQAVRALAGKTGARR